MRIFLLVFFLLSFQVKAQINDTEILDNMYEGCIGEIKRQGQNPIGPWYAYCGCFVSEVSQAWSVNDLIEFENNPNNRALANDFNKIVNHCVSQITKP